MSGEAPAVREALAVYVAEAPETEIVPPGYKQTEVGVIPEDWEITNLGNVVTLQRGYDLPQRTRRSGTIPVVSSSGIYDTHNQSQVRGPGVVTGRYGTVGEVFFIREDFWPLNTTLFVKDFKGNDPLFISFMLSTIDFESHSGKSGVPGVNRNDLHGLDVAVPPVFEQRAIAAALSDVDALIAALDELVAKKRAVKTAAMQQLLTGKQRLPGFGGEWEKKQLGDVFSFLSTANNPRSDLSESEEIGYVHYGDLHAINSPFLDCSKAKMPRIERSMVKQMPLLEEGDLVMADASEDYEGVGKSVEVRHVSGRKLVAGLHTFLLRGDKQLVADGFKGYLQYISSVRSALIRIATGISVYGISKNNVKNIEVSLPPLKEQTAIATVLSDMDAEIEALEARREKTRRIKQGMMQELLTGRTRLV